MSNNGSINNQEGYKPMSNNTPFESTLGNSQSQHLFIYYSLATLVDLTVLNLFSEFWHYVHIELFSISLLTAVLLQFLLKVTIKIEHHVADYFKRMGGLKGKILRIQSTWGILFSSKFAILGAINFIFGSSVVFSGPVHGIVAFIVVVTAIIIAEQAIARIHKLLA